MKEMKSLISRWNKADIALFECPPFNPKNTLSVGKVQCINIHFTCAKFHDNAFFDSKSAKNISAVV